MPLKLHLTNTLTKEKEVFTPIDPTKVYVYVCGITPYDYAHIGHARCYINFDILIRTLKFLGYETVYIRNYTDIDDKLLDKARAQGEEMDYLKIAEHFIHDFKLQMERLGCETPTVEPRATETIPEMISLINILLDKGFAYISGDDVYFDIESVKNYGKLSGRNIDDLISGARVDIDKNKKNAGDFVLWKGNQLNKFWETPFGYGRPGWHIECSAMIAKNCANRPLDIHAGGYDLIFPHHENEIAQSESAYNYKLANYWLHNAFVKMGSEKMSKSLGNTVSLNRMLEQTNPVVFRFYVMQHAYTKPLDFCPESLHGAKKPVERLAKFLTNTETVASLTFADIETLTRNFSPEQKTFFASICTNLVDDLNTSAVLGLIFKELDKIGEWSSAPKNLLATFIKQILGLNFAKLETQKNAMTPEIEALLQLRDKARAAKDFHVADKIRNQLLELGFSAPDKKLE